VMRLNLIYLTTPVVMAALLVDHRRRQSASGARRLFLR
jgi:hypothetical protein